MLSSNSQLNLAAFAAAFLVTLIFGVLVFNTADGKEAINYSNQTFEEIGELDHLNIQLQEADVEYQYAVSKRNSLQQSVCAQQILTAQAKFLDTPSHMTEELQRLHDSAEQARRCLGLY